MLPSSYVLCSYDIQIEDGGNSPPMTGTESWGECAAEEDG